MNIIVTMIAPAQGGAGDYLEEVRNQFDEFSLISPVNPNLSNDLVNKLLIEIQKITLKVFILLAIPFINLNKVIIYHPQTIGYWLSSHLIRHSSFVYYFILDASIFCIKSYNHRDNNVCTKCIEKISPYKDCGFFPRKNSIKLYRKHREVLSLELHKIQFIVQTTGYQDIVKSIFGKTTICRILKMKFPSIKIHNIEGAKKNMILFFTGIILRQKAHHMH